MSLGISSSVTFLAFSASDSVSILPDKFDSSWFSIPSRFLLSILSSNSNDKFFLRIFISLSRLLSEISFIFVLISLFKF